MPKNDLEVFEYLLADEQTPVEIDYLTYALFAYKKNQWVSHFEKENSKKPAPADIDHWISQLTAYDFTQMRNEAAEFFDESAKEYLAEYIENEKKSAVATSILDSVKNYTSPWKHLGIALSMAILAPVLLGGIIFLISLFDNSFPVHLTFEKQRTETTTERR